MKDRLFVDTNVMLDLLGERVPFYDDAAKIASLAYRGELNLIVSALSYPTVYYLLSRFEDHGVVKEKLRKFRAIAETSDLTDNVIDKGLSSGFSDFEDAMQYHCALNANCNVLITRNEKDFKDSGIAVMTPSEYVTSLRS